MEFVESLYGPMVQGEKSDPPVGTGRGLKLRASKAAERGRSDISGRPCFLPPDSRCIFSSCNFVGTPHLHERRPKGSKTT